MHYDLQVRAAIAYIENRVRESVTSDEIAKAVGYDFDYFRNIFKRSTRLSISRYVRLRRLSNAAFDLRNSTASIVDIAMRYGFGSHDVFTRGFKREFGVTPSEFRAGSKGVRGTCVIPGVFVPVVSETEEDSVMVAGIDEFSTVLYGVPRVSYHREGDPELTPFISSLRACLTYAGQEISYARLLAGSGAAFRLMWNTKCWDGGNVDILCMREDPFEPIRRALSVSGRGYTLLAKDASQGNRQAMVDLIRKEVDAGRPLIGFGIIGPPEACVITGYKEHGDVLTGWNFFQEMPEWKEGLEFEPCGYFSRRGWYEHSETRAILAVGDSVGSPDDMQLLSDTLSLAYDVMTRSMVHDHAGGQAAFRAWETAITDESQFPRDAILPMLMERLMCQADAFTMVAEGRAYACSFMHEMGGRIPQLKDALLAIGAILWQEHEAAREMPKYHGGLGMGETQAREFAKPENRRAIAALIRRCAEFDARATEKIGELIKGL